MKTNMLLLFVFMLLVSSVSARVADTAAILTNILQYMKIADKLSCKYEIDAKFPNGDLDHIAGRMCIDMEHKLYYNSSNSYVIIYTPKWFYRADHQKKTVSVTDMKSGNDKKLQKEMEKSIFQNGMLKTFLDSFLLKKGKVTQLKCDQSICNAVITFPKTAGIQSFAIKYDSVKNLPISCRSIILQHVGVGQTRNYAKIIAEYNDFRKVDDFSPYQTNEFFVYTKGKIMLKKYNNYQLIH